VFCALAAFGGVLTVLIACNPLSDPFLSSSRCALLLALNALFIGLYFFAPLKIFCSTFLLCLVLNNAAVNPIMTGLGPLLRSEGSAAVQEIKRSDPRAKWMGYGSAIPAQFLKAQGADVVTGLNHVPNVPFWRQFDPAGKFDAIYNRYGFAVFTMATGSREFVLVPPVIYSVDVLPIDPLLSEQGVRYAAFSDEVSEPDVRGLRLISHPANARLWLYQVAGSP
jgi:hypothetical protein